MNIESTYGYRPGGYHPVHLDDKFHNGRYTVVNKLGHGTYAVVWLVYDSQIGRYAALKICAANLERFKSRVSDEIAVVKHLQHVCAQSRQSPDENDEGNNHVVQIFDIFTHEDQTGHICVSKLGHGTYAVVWLVYDSQIGRYAALKICIANLECSKSRASDEIAVVKYLQHVRAQSSQSPDNDDEGNNHVVQISDIFTHKGPNGTHLCIVTEILGPNLADALFYIYREDPAPTGIAKRLAAQVAYGLRYLHKHGIVHGDLHIRNVLLYAPTIISSLSSQEHIEKVLGKPRRYIPQALEAQNAPAFDSESALNPHNPQISRSGSRIRSSHCPEVSASPELFFDNLHSPASDIWALVHLINYLFLRQYLFSEPASFSRAVMVLKLGKFPERWWRMWSGSANGSDTSASSDASESSDGSKFSEERWDWFDEDENWCSTKRKRPGKAVGGKWLMFPMQFPFEGEAEEDRAMVERILRKMTLYDIEKRATAAEVVELIPDRWMRDRPGEEGIDWPRIEDSDSEG
ncbi:kinase-like protein [Gymnopus androsaceus JB14]|uniref:non-specific serine/threonine protein kinase n=1 Tax=Gymnopus androsaceus JB14 TaxID=1447944 RepID=A0A6A4GM86_9AGAR|nr:kinase-like protein [Gymnopus androsaceus JB14]